MRPWRYTVAIGACSIALLLKLALGPEIAPGAFITFYGAVVFSAWYGGLGAGLLATAVSTGLAMALFMSWTTAAGALDEITIFRVVLFVAIATALSALMGKLESSRRRILVAEERYRRLVHELEHRIRERTEQLSRANRSLLDEVAARQQTADALRDSEQRFASAFRDAPIGMILFRLGESPVVMETNRAFQEMLGYADGGFDASGMEKLIRPDDVREARADMQRLLSGETDGYQVERRFVHRAGHLIWAQVSVSIVRTSDALPLYLIAQLQDITARRRAEEALRASEASYRHLVQNISDGIFVVDHAGAVTYVSPAIEVVSGYHNDELSGRSFLDFVHPDDRDVAWAAFERARAAHVQPAEFRCVTRAGKLRWVRSTGSPVLQSDGQVGMRALLIDMTEVKEVEKAIAEREARFQAMMSTISDIVVLLDAEGRTRYLGPSVSRLLGYRSEELMNGFGFDLVHPEDHAATRGVFDELVREPGKTVMAVYRMQHRDGSFRWLESIATNRLDDPAVGHVVLTARDITERKQFEHDLRESELKFRTLAETAAAAIFIYQQGLLRYVNPAGEELTGYNQTELLATDLWNLIDRRFRDTARRRGTARLRGEEVPPRAVVRLVRKDGAKRWVDFTAALIQYNQAPAILGTAFDITDRRRAEKDARHRQAELAHVLRVSTMGEMASGLAHELNQPLQAVVNFARGCVYRLQAKGNGMSDLQEPLNQIAHEALRAGEIIRRIRRFVRKDTSKREAVNLNDLVVEAARILAAEAMQDGVVVELVTVPDLPLVQADAVQLEQVILNLMKNGIEAMPADKCSERTLHIETSMPRPDAVEVRIRDTGEGFGPELAEQVFTPFYTTKPNGLGMGLSISRSIVTAHGGTLWASSTPGRGATFGFTLGLNNGAGTKSRT